MNKLYIFLISVVSSFFGYAQYQEFQLVLVNPDIGSEEFAGCYGCGYESNDDGLNSIFQTHNVVYYQTAYVYSGIPEDIYGAIHLGACDSCDVNQLVSDLNDYSSVVMIASSAEEDESLSFNHGLGLQLVDNSVGEQIGENNGVILTNNSELNTLFSNYNVSYYELVNPGTSYERYELLCDCDATLLRQDLDDLDTIISSTEVLYMVVLLSVDEERQTVASVYPNPFEENVTIEINKAIDSILLYDILGKSIYKSNSVSEMENYSKTLTSGVYLLKISTQEGEAITKRLIKS